MSFDIINKLNPAAVVEMARDKNAEFSVFQEDLRVVGNRFAEMTRQMELQIQEVTSAYNDSCKGDGKKMRWNKDDGGGSIHFLNGSFQYNFADKRFVHVSLEAKAGDSRLHATFSARQQDYFLPSSKIVWYKYDGSPRQEYGSFLSTEELALNMMAWLVRSQQTD